MPERRSPERLKFLRIDPRALFARKQFFRLVALLASVWVAYVFFISDQSVFRHTILKRENQALGAEIIQTENTLDSLETMVSQLETDRAMIERVARERFHLVADSEKTYIFVPVDKADRERLLREGLARKREREKAAEAKAEAKGERH